MNVSQLMNRSVDTCREEESLATAVGRMWERDIGCLVVLGDDGKAAGVVTDRDACMAAYIQGRPLHDLPVSVAMSKEMFCCAPEDSLIEAEEIMRAHKVRRLPVLDAHAQLAGIVSLNDLALESARENGRAGRQISGQEVSVTLAAICEPRGGRALTQPALGR